MQSDYKVHAGKDTITVKFPDNKPLCGWKRELEMRIGVSVQEISPIEMRFSWKIDADADHINDGLNAFVERHPEVFVYAGILGDT